MQVFKCFRQGGLQSRANAGYKKRKLKVKIFSAKSSLDANQALQVWTNGSITEKCNVNLRTFSAKSPLDVNGELQAKDVRPRKVVATQKRREETDWMKNGGVSAKIKGREGGLIGGGSCESCEVGGRMKCECNS